MLDLSPAMTDRIRGMLWERKYRGDYTDLYDSSLRSLVDKPPLWATGLDNGPKVGRPLEIPGRLGLGTYRWKYEPAVIERALELGVAVIDTAEGYGYGKVEIALGKILERAPREKTLIATKVSRNHMTYKACLNAGLRSRERLKVERIDLYQIHWPVFPIEPVLDAMKELLQRRVIRAVGVCNFCAEQLAYSRILAKKRDFDLLTNQIRVNMKDRAAKEFLIPYCEKLGVRTIAYSPLAQGELKTTPTEGLKWVLDSSGASCAIPATNNTSHLSANMGLLLKLGE